MKITFKHGNNTATQIAVEGPEDLTLERLTSHLEEGGLDTVVPEVTRKLLEHIRRLDGFSRNADLKVDLSGSPLKWSNNSSPEVSTKRRGISDLDPLKPVRKKRRTQPGPSFLKAPQLELSMSETQEFQNSSEVSEEYRKLCKRIAMNDGDLPSLKASRARYIIRDLFNGRSLLHREGLKIVRIGGSVEPGEISDEFIKRAIGRDFGIDDLDSIYFVEQPGTFHLDLGMALLGEGVVGLNDSGLVQENLLRWPHEDRALIKEKLEQSPEYSDVLALELDQVMVEMEGHIRGYCDQMRIYETQTLEALMKVDNLVIKQVAGFYPATLNSPCMNFLNGEMGLGRGERGFFVTNGGSSRGEDAFVQSVEELNHTYPGPLQRVYFVDPCLSGGTLRSMGGGAGCRLNTATDFYKT